MFNFCITRVVGNQLPPKDIVGGKIKSLKHVLEMDEDIPCEKIWIINRIIDQDYLKEIKDLLNKKECYEIKFSLKEYKSITNQKEKISYLTNINPARNQIIKISQKKYRYTISLDQDCFLLKENWSELTEFIKQNNKFKYFSLILKRITEIKEKEQEPNNEPMLIFRDDADLLFNENIIFGNNDKIELLLRLGCIPKKWTYKGDICANAGYVMHIGYDQRIEKDIKYRCEKRKVALDNLVKRADSLKKQKLI